MIKKSIDEFSDYLIAERNYSDLTLTNYRKDIEQFIEICNIKSLDGITKQSIRSFLGMLSSKGRAVSTRNRKLASIRSYCKFLVAENYIDSDPSIDVKSAKIGKSLPKTLSESETQNMIDYVEDPRDRAILETLYGIGARVSELVNIRIKDIDFKRMQVKLSGKGSNERIVPANRASIESILKYLSTKESYSDNDFLFTSPILKGSPITDRTVRNIVSKYGKLNNIEGVTPHRFRHSFATHLHANGLSIRDIQELLGHSNINTTMIYTSVVMDNLSRNFHSTHPRS